MNDRENFVTRWSRLKRGAATPRNRDENEAAAGAEPARRGEAGREPDAGGATENGSSAEPPFDITKLPPVETITPETDIRDFLRPGVPLELTKAALRRVWTSDPVIRDFVGIAENQWDFTDPAAIPGFGPLLPADIAARDLVMEAATQIESLSSNERVAAAQTSTAPAFRDAAPAGAETTPASSEHSHAAPDGAQEPPVSARDASAAASQHPDSEEPSPRQRRTHGRAIPR